MKGLIFTYVMAYGGSAVALFRPFTGLLVYIAFALLSPESLWFWAVSQGNYSRLVAVALLTGWGLQGFGDWRLGQARGVVLSLIGFLLVWVVDAWMAPDRELGFMWLESFVKVVLPFLAGVTLIGSVAQLRRLAWVIVLSQGYLAGEFNRRYFAGQIVETEFSFRGLDNNGIAITMVTSLGLALFLGVHARGGWRKAVAFVAALLMAHVVLFSMSRGGMLAMAVVGAVGFALVPKQPKHYLTFLLAVALVLRLAGPSVQKEFLSSFDGGEQRDASASTRMKHWGACVSSMIQRPLGVGPDHWPRFAPEYGLPAMEAHTTWLQLGAEFGVQGLACIGTFYGLCAARLWRLTRERVPVPDPWLRYLARMVLASLAGFLVSAQFVSVEGVELPYFVMIIGAGVLKLASARPAPGPRRRAGATRSSSYEAVGQA